MAAVERATAIYSDDEDIRKLTEPRMQVIGIEDLPLPPETPQADMFWQFDTSSAGPEGVSGYTEGR
ncbi:hypothetical protein [Aurantimonas sp. C2-4-R8]|uniref:hypothetical protein n=1 Tax=Aurantimonas sp. C2-4-R8 TaxID=3114364 RepID=UPI002E19DE3D|nr:hypothetical protein [Aurantimonas sp. C2-3-R2]